MTNMSRARVARRIAAGAAYGGGGVGLVGAAAVGLVLAEVRMARTAVHNGNSGGRVPTADGCYGWGSPHPGVCEGGGGYRGPGVARGRLTLDGGSSGAGRGVD
ncbi:SGNH/GDSL hydrolase family protein, partial [Streptomyces sp. NPDC059627]